MGGTTNCWNLMGCPASNHVSTCPGWNPSSSTTPTVISCSRSEICSANAPHYWDCPQAKDDEPTIGVDPNRGKDIRAKGPYLNRIQLEPKAVPRWNGYHGVWTVWDYGNDGGEQADTIHHHPVRAIEALSRLGHGRIAFWRFDMSLKESIEWYAAEQARMDEDERQLTER